MTKQSERSAARAVIFDLGKVLVDFDRGRTYQAFARTLYRDIGTIQDAVEQSDLRQRYETGAINTPAFRKELRRTLDCVERDLPDELLDEGWSDMFEPHPEMVELVKRVRGRGIPLLLLSNTDPLHFDHIRRTYQDVLAPFHEVVLSYEAKVAKPNPAIFRLALDKLRNTTPDLHAGDIIFVDDSAEHVTAARSLGLRGFTFRSHGELVRWLGTQGMDVPG